MNKTLTAATLIAAATLALTGCAPEEPPPPTKTTNAVPNGVPWPGAPVPSVPPGHHLESRPFDICVNPPPTMGGFDPCAHPPVYDWRWVAVPDDTPTK